MMQQDRQLHASIRSLIESYFSCLRRPVRKNLARLTCAFLHLAWSIRFGYGGLHLTSIARVLPEGKDERVLTASSEYLPLPVVLQDFFIDRSADSALLW